ncbi:MAG: hypothetical protein N2321_02730 [Melioribacteraceae bacterium]|nr:hypothetical protein [Melioribacteraceae bacterium]
MNNSKNNFQNTYISSNSEIKGNSLNFLHENNSISQSKTNGPFKNINIQIPTAILNKIKILAIEKDLYLKDYIVQILEKEITNAK